MARRITLRAAALVPALALTLASAGCIESTTPGKSADGSVALVEPGKLTTCTHLPYEPFQFPGDGGRIIGFDVDLVDLVAEDLGVEQKIVDAPFEEGIQSGESLNMGDCDIAAAAMTITESRKQNLDFSDPYFDADQALLVARGSGIARMDQLRGKNLGVQVGTTGQTYADENQQAGGYEVTVFDDVALLQSAVQTGQVDAAINDNGVVRNFAKNNPDTQVTDDIDTGEQYGLGIRKGSDDMRERVNRVLREAHESGEYDRIYAKWFGEPPS